MLPYLLLGFGKVPTMLARLIASLAVGISSSSMPSIRDKVFLILTAVMMEITYA